MKKQGKPPKTGEERMLWELRREKIPDKWQLFEKTIRESEPHNIINDFYRTINSLE